MQVGFLITNGGTHSPEKWAATSCEQIIKIAADAAGEQAIEGRRLELKLLDILEGHYAIVQSEEKEGLSKWGEDRYATPIDVKDRVDAAWNDILQASKGSLFEKHFMQENVQDHVREVLRKDAVSIMEIERSWHKDEMRKKLV